MRIVAVGAALLLLAGCYSPSDLMKGQPGLVVASTKSAKAFALCAFPALAGAQLRGNDERN